MELSPFPSEVFLIASGLGFCSPALSFAWVMIALSMGLM